VVVTATDAAGNAASCRYDVTVRDTTPPTVTCPADLMAAGSRAAFEITASDAVDPAPIVFVDHGSGSVFAPGETVVHATALDRFGNSSRCSFTVTATDEGGRGGCGCGSGPAGGMLLLAALLLRRVTQSLSGRARSRKHVGLDGPAGC
jgi:hypothetical protein